MKNAPVIRIVKKKRGHGGHHGGAWKVAYADFVTAMMAFFLVMWIVSTDQALKQKIQAYFNDPYSVPRTTAGISKLAAGGTSPIANGFAGVMSANNSQRVSVESEKRKFRRVRQILEREIAGRSDLSRLGKHVTISLTAEGLQIELIEAEDSLFFESGSARLPQPTRTLLALIAHELGQLPNPVVIEGHTDVVPYRGEASYSNWELSADRANAARRSMQASGLQSHQVVEVRGYADTRLRDPEHPTHYSNRRVAILVRYSDRATSAATVTRKLFRPRPQPPKEETGGKR